MIPGCTQDFNLNALNRKPPTRFYDNMGMASDRFFISRIIGTRHFGVFQIGSVIEECANLDSVDQRGNSADVIAVIVGDQDIIELLAGRLDGCGDDAVGIATFVAWPTGIDQQRFARWAHDQSRLPALDVDEVNLQRLLKLAQRSTVLQAAEDRGAGSELASQK